MNPTLIPRGSIYQTIDEVLASFESGDDFTYCQPGSDLHNKVCCREDLRKFGICQVNLRYRPGKTIGVAILGKIKEEYQP